MVTENRDRWCPGRFRRRDPHAVVTHPHRRSGEFMRRRTLDRRGPSCSRTCATSACRATGWWCTRRCAVGFVVGRAQTVVRALLTPSARDVVVRHSGFLVGAEPLVDPMPEACGQDPRRHARLPPTTPTCDGADPECMRRWPGSAGRGTHVRGPGHDADELLADPRSRPASERRRSGGCTARPRSCCSAFAHQLDAHRRSRGGVAGKRRPTGRRPSPTITGAAGAVRWREIDHDARRIGKGDRRCRPRAGRPGSNSGTADATAAAVDIAVEWITASRSGRSSGLPARCRVLSLTYYRPWRATVNTSGDAG